MREYVLFVILIFIPIGLGLHYFLRREGLPNKEINIILGLALFIIFSFPICMARMGIYCSLLIYLIIIVAMVAYLLRLGENTYLETAFASLRSLRQRADLIINEEPDLTGLTYEEATNLLLGSLEATARELLGPVSADSTSGLSAAVAEPALEFAELSEAAADDQELPLRHVVAEAPEELAEEAEAAAAAAAQPVEEITVYQAEETGDILAQAAYSAEIIEEAAVAVPKPGEVYETTAETGIEIEETVSEPVAVAAVEEAALETTAAEAEEAIPQFVAEMVEPISEEFLGPPEESELPVLMENTGATAELVTEPELEEPEEEVSGRADEPALITESEAAEETEPAAGISVIEEVAEETENVDGAAEASAKEPVELTVDTAEIIEADLEETAGEALPEAEQIEEPAEEVTETLAEDELEVPFGTKDRVDGDDIEEILEEIDFEIPTEAFDEDGADDGVHEPNITAEEMVKAQAEDGDSPESTRAEAAVVVDEIPVESLVEELVSRLDTMIETIPAAHDEESEEPAEESRAAPELETLEEELLTMEDIAKAVDEPAVGEAVPELDETLEFSAAEPPAQLPEPEAEPGVFAEEEREEETAQQADEPEYAGAIELEELNRWIDQGFHHKSNGDVPAAIYAFVQAWNRVYDRELKYLITLELVELYKECGYYNYAEQVLGNYLELGGYKSDIIYEINRQLDGIRFLATELTRLGMTGVPWAQVPRWIRMELEDKLNQ